jgi:pseudomonalisin
MRWHGHVFSAVALACAAAPLTASAQTQGGDVSLAVVLNYRHPAELERLVRSQGTPGNALYHRFLTQAQFAAYFAPAPETQTFVANALQRAGFRLVRTYPNRTVLDLRAPAPVAARYFAAGMPRELRAFVRDVRGLHTGVRFSPGSAFAGAGAREAETRAGGVTPDRVRGPDFGYTPNALAAAYEFPVENGDAGHGRVTGIVAPSNLFEKDLVDFAAFFKLKAVHFTRVPIDGGGKYDPGTLETQTATLVAEAIAGTAPGTHLYLYDFAYLDEQHILDAYTQAVSDDAVDVLDSSFAGCELGSSFATDADALAQQGEAEGMTFVASSGDAGGAECGKPHGGQAAPASSPHFVAAGGTRLKLTGKAGYVNETAWNYSGGGISAVFPLPDYQSGLTGASQKGRNVPDLAFDGDPDTGMSLLLEGRWFGPGGGTELSAALYSALQTDLDQIQNGRAGYANPWLYAAFASEGYTLFRDITTGSNGSYRAATGYDDVSGIGSPLGTALAGAL